MMMNDIKRLREAGCYQGRNRLKIGWADFCLVVDEQILRKKEEEEEKEEALLLAPLKDSIALEENLYCAVVFTALMRFINFFMTFFSPMNS